MPTPAAGWVTANGATASTGPTDRPFPIASVTKPLFAYAVLVAVEEGTVELDAPAGPEGATVRHLLAHASGLGDDPNEPIARVGRRRIYANGGFEALGRHLAAKTGFDAGEYATEAVIRPLGLDATTITGSVAYGAVSSVDDLLTLGREWLRPTLIAASTLAEATSTQFPELSGVLPGFGRQDPNPWGLGFEIRGIKSPHWTGSRCSPATFGHFGRSGSFVWVDPAIDTACVGLADRDFGPWAAAHWPRYADAVVDEVAGRPTLP